VITKKQMLAELVILMGGREAELLVFEDISSGSENDVLRASRLARDMVCRWGMSEGFGVRVIEDDDDVSEPLAQKRDEAIETMLAQSRAHAKKILQARRDHLKLLGEALIVKKVMQRNEIIKLLGEE
jgi:cell division protease FtsH